MPPWLPAKPTSALKESTVSSDAVYCFFVFIVLFFKDYFLAVTVEIEDVNSGAGEVGILHS